MSIPINECCRVESAFSFSQLALPSRSPFVRQLAVSTYSRMLKFSKQSTHEFHIISSLFCSVGKSSIFHVQLGHKLWFCVQSANKCHLLSASTLRHSQQLPVPRSLSLSRFVARRWWSDNDDDHNDNDRGSARNWSAARLTWIHHIHQAQLHRYREATQWLELLQWHLNLPGGGASLLSSSH